MIQNMKTVLPVIFDDFISYKDIVANHPRLKSKLHEMRIAGKPMRYIMEILLPYAVKQFEKCYDEVKYVLELTGDIHDCDVFIPELISHLREIREFNKRIENAAERISTRAIRQLIQQLREKRYSKYEELCGILSKWEKEGFRETLMNSI